MDLLIEWWGVSFELFCTDMISNLNALVRNFREPQAVDFFV